MSSWLLAGEVLEGEGRGEMSPCSPRIRGTLSPRFSQGRGRTTLQSPVDINSEPKTMQQDILGKATELFLLCDKEAKGFITKRDMQCLQSELPLTPDQLESVFESLDQEKNGFLTPVEFRKGLGELVWVPDEESVVQLRQDGEDKVDPDEKFMQTLKELGADAVLKNQRDIHTLWYGLRRDHPELLCFLEELLSHVASQLRDALKEQESLEQVLHRREMDHDQVLRSVYEEMETQLREEREARLTQNSARESDRCQQLQEELRMCEQELENSLAKQKELEGMVCILNSEQVETRGQNQKLQQLNLQLQGQLEACRTELDGVLREMHNVQASSACQQQSRERGVLKVSKNMQKEKESLMRQLELLREMNKRLRDEKDVHQSQKRVTYQPPVIGVPQLPQYSWENAHSLWLHPFPPYWVQPPFD
ncbi:EF-hand calcium-binding domain-containing protein 4A [Arapaima gigas]